jgi:hypothetical protein
MPDTFTLKPGLTSLELIDALGCRLPAGLAALTADNADFEQGQWAGIYLLQECVTVLAALADRFERGDAEGARHG